jgi:hypothetical protein
VRVEGTTLKVGLGIAVGFACGFVLAWTMRAPSVEPAPAAQASAAPAATAAPLNPFAAPALPTAAVASALPANASVDALWTAAQAPPGQQQGYEAEDRLRKLAQSDPTVRRNLLQRYGSAATPQERELLKSLLSTVQQPEVIAFANRLAGSSNAAERKYGFELLQSLAPDAPETRSLVRRTLASEQSPEVIVQALASLRSAATEPEETDQIVAQLALLARHADAAVRSHSVALLGQWDRKGDADAVLAQALGDQHQEVRQAAIFAIGQSGTRAPALKTALMTLANNSQESRDIRGSALQVLERFALSKEDYASLAQSRMQLQAR